MMAAFIKQPTKLHKIWIANNIQTEWTALY